MKPHRYVHVQYTGLLQMFHNSIWKYETRYDTPYIPMYVDLIAMAVAYEGPETVM